MVAARFRAVFFNETKVKRKKTKKLSGQVGKDSCGITTLLSRETYTDLLNITNLISHFVLSHNRIIGIFDWELKVSRDVTIMS